MTTKQPICRQCKYYFITWDAKLPYGCKAFSFKTRRMPSLDVFRSSGKPCIKFTQKSGATKI
ncbi:MAG: uracil-DNA glycosylase [Ghiorsea sp.]|nr:uracil-DNA glycosylase [Ghiorsea sp.]MDQ6981109.1 uracil-DNA glycosylase [Ghiorsea sp.]MDQ7058930.1 uracil-DNA glycosylase [Ghiorsea sp.]